MKKIFLLCSILLGCSSSITFAEDYSDRAANAYKIRDWYVVQFVDQKAIIYKAATESVNENLKDSYLSFYFSTADKCEPSEVELNMVVGTYSTELDGGMVPFSFKIPGGETGTDVADSFMNKNDSFAFFRFKKITPKVLMAGGGKGNLSIWIPTSGNGEVNESSNMYYSMNGVIQAYTAAHKLCSDNL